LYLAKSPNARSSHDFFVVTLQLLLLLVHAEREADRRGKTPAKGASLAWTSDGKAIKIRDTRELTNKLLPLLAHTDLGQAKFSSFLRRLYRWGFRQVSSSSSKNKCDDHARNEKVVKAKVFCHPLFQRDNKPLVEGMKSITAEGNRRAASSQHLTGIRQERQLLSCVDSSQHIQTLDQSMPNPIGNSSLLEASVSACNSNMTSSARASEHLFLGTSPMLLLSARALLGLNDPSRQDCLNAAIDAANVAATLQLQTVPLFPSSVVAGNLLPSLLNFSTGGFGRGTASNLVSLEGSSQFLDANQNERNLATAMFGNGRISSPRSWREALLRSIILHREQFPSLDC
jgi:hypothetical protein